MAEVFQGAIAFARTVLGSSGRPGGMPHCSLSNLKLQTFYKGVHDENRYCNRWFNFSGLVVNGRVYKNTKWLGH